MPAAWQSLARINEHERDKYVQFDEPTHIYTVKGKTAGYISVTKFLHEFFPHFDADAVIDKMMNGKKWNVENKWFGMTKEEIKAAWDANGKEASGAGTLMHLSIEQFLNGAEHLISQEMKDTPEWHQFMNFWKEHGHDLAPYRTEWEVWAEEYKLTGSIDMIFYRKSDDSYVVYDWKRAKDMKTANEFGGRAFYPLDHLHDTNYWHYTLQLNVYRWFLETYYGLRINDMYLIVLHPNQKNYRRFQLNRLEDEIAEMMEARMRAVKGGCKQKVILPNPACEIADD
jgi:ATP-dependent exoDNAse (exonuclease V) beta subunit